MQKILCADPDSFQLYTFQIDSNQIIREKNVPVWFHKKVIKEINEMKSVLKLDNGFWLCESNQLQKFNFKKKLLFLNNNYQIKMICVFFIFIVLNFWNYHIFLRYQGNFFFKVLIIKNKFKRSSFIIIHLFFIL